VHFCDAFHLSSTQGKAMEIKHILIIMFVVFCLFMLANWFNRPQPTFRKSPDKPTGNPTENHSE
jgi:hypothetical protein